MSPVARAPAILHTAEGLAVGVRVTPSARRTSLRGLYGDRVKIAVSAPPEGNRANLELLEALASWVGVARESVQLRSGHASRDKVIVFAGIAEADLAERFAQLLAGRDIEKEN